MDGHGPYIDQYVEEQVDELVHGEEEDVDVVGQTLGEPVEGVEGVAGEGTRHLPLVVGLVDVLVDERVVEPPVDPVDHKVSEHDEGQQCSHDTPPAYNTIPVSSPALLLSLGHL